MTRRLVEEAPTVHHPAAFGIRRSQYEATQASEADGSRAHGARLERHRHSVAGKPVVLQTLGGAADGQDLRMRRRIMKGDGRIRRPGDHLAGREVEDDRSHRDFPREGGGLRRLQGKAHHRGVMVDHPASRTSRPPVRQGATAGERVAKRLARAGVASRREIERLIEAGRVALNGQVLTTPAVNVGANDILTVDGKVTEDAEPTRVFRYHKPSGLVTTHSDPKGRPTVFEALPPGLPRVISVGRLDLNSEGLLLLTNDGELSRALELPSSDWLRRYRARARGRVDQAKLDSLREGITVEGVRYGPIEATLDKAKEGPQGANLWLTVALAEGKNREVRRVLEALGLTVNRLIRVAYGPFALGVLAQGAVEEVGPRVLREQLSGVIAPANMPTGDRAQYKPPEVAPKTRASRQKTLRPSEPAPPKVYKEGWARPKKKPPVAVKGKSASRATRGPPRPR